MERLIVATNNAGKAREIKAMTEGFEVLSLKDAGIVADVVEDGTTFLENAAKKATEISAMVDGLVLADDSGLCVDGLGGAPGVYSARFSEEGTDAANNAKLIAAIKDMDEEQRRGRFVCAMVVAEDGEVIFSCEGKVEGVIIPEQRGNGGFGYDPMFYVEKYGKTFGELTADEKNLISHRANALKQVAEFLDGYGK